MQYAWGFSLASGVDSNFADQFSGWRCWDTPFLAVTEECHALYGLSAIESSSASKHWGCSLDMSVRGSGQLLSHLVSDHDLRVQVSCPSSHTVASGLWSAFSDFKTGNIMSIKTTPSVYMYKVWEFLKIGWLNRTICSLGPEAHATCCAFVYCQSRGTMYSSVSL